jgi:hypothetical protein
MRPTREFLRRTRSRARARAQQTGVALLRAAGRRTGYSVVRRDFYSPLVDTRTLPDDLWTRAAPIPGLDLDLDGQLEFLERRLATLVAEFRPPLRAADPPTRFHLENPMYGPMDAHLLYAFVREMRPQRVLELGSGYSTLVIQEALSRNARDGDAATHQVVDPYPSPLLEGSQAQLRIHRQSAAAVAPALFGELEDRDILFVDTSHAVRPGGDVVRIVLEVLPTLRAGVVVHVHDIFRPFEYPRVLYDVLDVHWQEQYLIQALLSDNPGFEILCANHALWRLRRERVLPMFPGLREGMEPSGFWLVRR